MSFEVLGSGSGVLPANADLSAKQFTFVIGGGTTSGPVQAATTLGQRVLGVLYNKPTAAQGCNIRSSGIVRVKVDAAVNVGDKITTAADGRAHPTTTTGHWIHGEALEAATAANQIIAIQLYPNSGIV